MAAQSQMPRQAPGIAGETAKVRREAAQSQMELRSLDWHLRSHAMARSPQAPIEISPAEIGDRLSAVRLLPSADQEMVA